ncbi:MAG: hypothetical protein FJY67_12010 [Calditrichaeota bacterium]|nr:hypothetical protein [Calditrichota bacterium]
MLSLNLFRKPALRLAACLLLLAGILVWPVPQPARADQLPVSMQLNWNNFSSGDAEVTCQQIDQNGNAVGPLKEMNPQGSSFEYWSFTFDELHPDAVSVRISWLRDPAGANINNWTGPGGAPPREPPQVFPILGGLCSGYAEAH